MAMIFLSDEDRAIERLQCQDHQDERAKVP
jgi:hypothetical protein